MYNIYILNELQEKEWGNSVAYRDVYDMTHKSSKIGDFVSFVSKEFTVSLSNFFFFFFEISFYFFLGYLSTFFFLLFKRS